MDVPARVERGQRRACLEDEREGEVIGRQPVVEKHVVQFYGGLVRAVPGVGTDEGVPEVEV